MKKGNQRRRRERMKHDIKEEKQKLNERKNTTERRNIRGTSEEQRRTKRERVRRKMGNIKCRKKREEEKRGR